MKRVNYAEIEAVRVRTRRFLRNERKQMQAEQILVAKREIRTATKIYPVGSAVPLSVLGERLQVFLDSRFVMWKARSDRPLAQPRDIVPAARARPRPDVIEIVPDRDPVTSFKKTKAKLVAACGGDVAVAMDLIAANPEAAALQKRATHEACAREAKRRGVVSVSPDQAAL